MKKNRSETNRVKSNLISNTVLSKKWQVAEVFVNLTFFSYLTVLYNAGIGEMVWVTLGFNDKVEDREQR